MTAPPVRSPTLASESPALTALRRQAGLVVALLLGLTFGVTQLDKLTVNLQYDGQLPEYLAWTQAPAAWGKSLNADLNRYLYSVYYTTLAAATRWLDRETVLKLTFVAEILALCGAVYVFVLRLTGDRWAAWLAVAVDVWQRGSALVPGGSSTVGIVASPEYPATALALLALAQSWQGRHARAALLAGLAFNLHGSIAAFAGLMVVFAAGARFERIRGAALTVMIRVGATFIVAAAPTLAWISLNPPPAAAMSTIDWLRFPHWIYPDHMLPSATPARLWLMLAACLTPGLIGLGAAVEHWRPQRRILAGWIVATGLLLAVGYIFVEIYPIRLVAQLTLFRGARFLILVVLGFGLSYLLAELRRPGFAGFTAALTLVAYVTPLHPELAWVGHLGLTGLLAVIATRVETRQFRIAAAAGVVLGLGLIVYDALHFARLDDYISWRWPLAGLALACMFFAIGRSVRPVLHAVTLVILVTLNLWLARVNVGNPVSTAAARRAGAVRDLAPLVAQACPPGQLVIAPPDIRNPGAWAGRGSYLCRQQLTAYAYAPWLADEILRRMTWYLDKPLDTTAPRGPILPELARGYHARTESQFARLRDEYGVRVAIVERDQHLNLRRVGGNELFDVYDLGEPRPRQRASAAHASASQTAPAVAASAEAGLQPLRSIRPSETTRHTGVPNIGPVPSTSAARAPTGRPRNSVVVTGGRARIVRANDDPEAP